MTKEMLKNILVVLLLTLTGFSIFKYAASIKEKEKLLSTLTQVSQRVTILENEKESITEELKKEKEFQLKLTAEIIELKVSLKTSEDKASRLFWELKEAKRIKEESDSQFLLLRDKYTALTEDKERTLQENEGLKTKLSSIVELKKVIRELKKQKRKAPRKAGGNRGYIFRNVNIKQGQLVSPKFKVEVIPAPVKQ